MECTICSDKMLLSSGTEMTKGIGAVGSSGTIKSSLSTCEIFHIGINRQITRQKVLIWDRLVGVSAASWGLTLWPLLALFLFGHYFLTLTSCQVPYQKLQEGKTHAWYIAASEDLFLSTNNPLLLFPKVVSLKQLWIIRFMLLKKMFPYPLLPKLLKTLNLFKKDKEKCK